MNKSVVLVVLLFLLTHSLLASATEEEKEFKTFPRLMKSVNEDKWQYAAKLLEQQEDQDFVVVYTTYDWAGSVKWQHYLIRSKNGGPSFQRLSYCYGKLVKNVPHT